MVWIPLRPSHPLHRLWHLRGRRNTISTIFLLSSVYRTWSSPWGFSVHIPTKFSGLQVCNARKREQTRKTAINFPSDGRFGPVFLSWNENDKNYAVGGEFCWFDLPIKLQKKQRGFQDLNSPMVWISLLPSYLLHRFWNIWGGRNTISSIFVLSSLYRTWSCSWGFSVLIPTKFSWPPSV